MLLPPDPKADEDPLAQFRPSASRRAAIDAALDWPNCGTPADGAATVCAEWSEGNVEFRLLALKGKNGPVPVISSSMIGQEGSDKIVIHLSGGPDDPPLSYVEDLRLDAFKYFYAKGFRVFSVGYWGTSFRALNEDNEIRLASQDLIDTYLSLMESCRCEPLIVAESLGAGVLFYTMRSRKRGFVFLAVSAVPQGLDHAVEYFRQSQPERDRSSGAKRSNLYVRDKGGQPVFDRSTLINTFQHLSRFSVGEDSAFSEEEFLTPCSKVVIGSEDPLSQGIAERRFSRLVVVDGAGHDLYKDAPERMRSVFEHFLKCVEK